MREGNVVCPLCASSFDPHDQAACRACPVGAGCALICCPSCGYSWVRTEHTRSGRFLGRLLQGRRRRQRSQVVAGRAPLTRVPPGWRARLVSWDSTPPRRRQQLRAYGLAEGEWILVLQHAPTTIIRVDQTELALERELAETIVVESAAPAEVPEPA